MNTAKISIIADDSRLMQQLVQHVNFLNLSIGETIDKPREAYMHLHPLEPRVVLLAEPLEEMSIPQIIQQLKKVNSSAPIIFMSREGRFEQIRELYRCGVSDVLRVPDELGQLELLLDKTVRQTSDNRDRSRAPGSTGADGGEVIALYSAKGGSGTTTAGINLAQGLAIQSGARVLLIDLNMQFGGLQQYLDIQFERNLGDLKSVLRELTYSQLDNVLYKLAPSDVHLLLSPAHPQEAENFKGEDIELLFAACRAHFDYIVLDLPKELNEISICALGQADRVLYLLHLDRPSIVRMKGVFDILERYHLTHEEKLSIVVNRHSKKNDVTLEHLEKMTMIPVVGVLSEDVKRNVQTSMNLGKPLLTEKKVKGLKGPAKDYMALAAALLKQEGGVNSVHLPSAKQSS